VLPGKAPVLAAVLWYFYRRNNSKAFVLTSVGLKEFGIARKAKYKALRVLEVAGLITVQYRPKRNPVVTLLETQDTSD
jgi:hypothetical protein